MTPEYIIMTSDYQTGADLAKEMGLEFAEWKWIRDRFKDPIAYKRVYKDIWATQISFE